MGSSWRQTSFFHDMTSTEKRGKTEIDRVASPESILIPLKNLQPSVQNMVTVLLGSGGHLMK